MIRDNRKKKEKKRVGWGGERKIKGEKDKTTPLFSCTHILLTETEWQTHRTVSQNGRMVL